MAIQAYDTQQGFTLTLVTDSLTLRLVSTTELAQFWARIRATHLGTTTDHEYVMGELADTDPVTVTYQNSPGLANPSGGLVQTITMTGPVAPGGTVAESVTGTGAVIRRTMLPGFSSESEALQMKSFQFAYDGFTGPTRTVGS